MKKNKEGEKKTKLGERGRRESRNEAGEAERAEREEEGWVRRDKVGEAEFETQARDQGRITAD